MASDPFEDPEAAPADPEVISPTEAPDSETSVAVDERSTQMAPSPETGARGSRTATRKKWAAPSLYTVLLALSLIFISISCLFLWLELKRFGSYPWWNTSAAMPANRS